METFRVWLVSLCVWGVFLTPVVAGGQETGSSPDISGIHLNTKGFSSSRQCGQCHEELYNDWKRSLHADASDNAVFQAAYMQVYFEEGERARPACLVCHAPVAYFNNDPKLTQAISREGVSCDFCHSIAEALSGTMEGPQFRFEFGGVKQGPLKNSKSPAHQTRFNGLYQQSQFCKGCHEQKSQKGIPIIATWSEWKESPYPDKGITCQKCHMEQIPGKTVAVSVQQNTRNRISNHDIAAGHSLTKRRQALEIKIVTIETHKNRIQVQVDLTNTGAGHKMPTGLPIKKIILEVKVQNSHGSRQQSQQRVYQKVLADAQGKAVTQVVDLMLGKATAVVSDNRIAPLEARRESFTFFVEKPEDQTVSAAAYYSYAPEILQPAPIHIKLNEVQRRVR
jgi:cytochrome c554/c'-like protein